MIENGSHPFRLKLVGLKMGGHPITDYAPDFWLIDDLDRKRVGYITSPWWSPDLGTNIAMGFVPSGLSATGTRLLAELPARYCEQAGSPVDAVVADMPFMASEHPSARER